MQITAKLIQLLPIQTGTGKNGEWKKQDFIVETLDQYPKKICFSIWGDKIQTASLEIDRFLKIDFDAESREFNGKWYTDLKAWKVEVTELGTSEKDGNDHPTDFSAADEDDVLPF
jgi:hypothetical protein